jgi:hypothetical protein
MDTNYENIYQIDTSCIYDTEHLKFVDLSYKIDEELTKLISKDRSNILHGYSNEDLLNLHKQIVPIEKIKRDILTYEFIYGVIDKICENELDVLNLLISELNQYQWVVGGFNIEDKEWLECGENTRFKPHKLQHAIYNSLESHNDDQELKWFLKTILRRISQTIKKETGIKIYYKIIEDTPHEISWVIIIVEKIDKNAHNSK